MIKNPIHDTEKFVVKLFLIPCLTSAISKMRIWNVTVTYLKTFYSILMSTLSLLICNKTRRSRNITLRRKIHNQTQACSFFHQQTPLKLILPTLIPILFGVHYHVGHHRPQTKDHSSKGYPRHRNPTPSIKTSLPWYPYL